MRRRRQKELAEAFTSLGALASVTGSSVRAWLPGHGDEPVTVRAEWWPGDRIRACGVTWGPWPRRRVWVWRTAGGIRGVQPRTHTGATAAGVVVLLLERAQRHQEREEA